MKYDEIVSLGSNCCPGLSLRNLNLKKETYPFDWVRNNSKIIYDVLLNGKDKFLKFNNKDISDDFYLKNLHHFTHKNFKGSHINYYGQHFTHYTELNTEELITKFNKYLNRFLNLLTSNKKVLFIHSNEEYIYHKRSRDHKVILYNYLCKTNDLIREKYPALLFKIINIDINNTFENYENITNLTMNYDLSLSDNCENHIPKFYNLYRDNITSIIKEFLKENLAF